MIDYEGVTRPGGREWKESDDGKGPRLCDSVEGLIVYANAQENLDCAAELVEKVKEQLIAAGLASALSEKREELEKKLGDDAGALEGVVLAFSDDFAKQVSEQLEESTVGQVLLDKLNEKEHPGMSFELEE